MSILLGPGFLMSYDETEITCPICTAVFDASAKIEKAKYPQFNTRCPKCKGKITIRTAFMGGELECWETDCPPTIERLKTITPNKVNGIPYDEVKRTEEDDEEGDEDEEDDPQPTTPFKPRSFLTG